MKITSIEIAGFTNKLTTTFKTALRTLDQVESVAVLIRTDTGQTGIGAASPTGVITGETTASIRGAIQHIGQQIRGRDPRKSEEFFQVLRSCLVGNNSAKAAVDMAVFDLLGKHYNEPVWRLLGGGHNRLTTDITISLNSPGEMVEESLIAVKKGFDVLKIKVGNDIDLDIERLGQIRSAVGKEIKIRVDANQGWRAKEAVRAIDRLQQSGVDLELVEQPVNRDDLEGLQYVTQNSKVPIIADESVFTPEDVIRLIRMKAVDGINIKLMKCGGIHNALKMAAIAETAGLSCMVGSMMESFVGVTAAVHFAAARSVITRYDLDAPLFLAENNVKGGISYQNATISLAEAPGLGIEEILDLDFETNS